MNKKIYVAVGERYPWFSFSEERNWASDEEVEVTEEELALLKEAEKDTDKQQKFLDEKYG